MTTVPGARLTGLGAAEVRQRTLAGAVNLVPSGPSRTVAEIVRANVVTLFNMLLGALLVVILVVAPPQDALFGGVLVANALIGIVQELRAKQTLDRLALLSAPHTTVIRDSRRQKIRIDEVVLDDLIAVGPGDQIVVDGLVVISEGLEVDESLLTGESDTVAKQHADEVLSGSFVAAGSGVYKARRVGPDAYAAQLAAEAKQFALTRSELRRGIDWILKAIGWVMTPTMALLVWSQMRANDELREAIRVAVGGMVAMIPQGLVLLTSVAFAVGVVRLGKRHVLVQELPALEMLARVDVVCFDKTGTLTKGHLSVDGLHLITDRVDTEAALGAVAAADPTPNATLSAIAEAYPAPAGWFPVRTVPFSSARKWSGAGFGRLGTWILGAPDIVLPGDPRVTGMVVAAAATGQRVLLLAVSDRPLEGEELPRDIAPVALVTLGDIVRAEAVDTIRFFVEQGVAPKVISGDHVDTVAAIARSVGLHGRVIDGRDLPEDPDLLRRAVEDGSVFGRITPHQKRDMVAALQASGHIVAMTGDGVNDVLALKKADIGIAMGSGSPASRAVSQVVLLDGDFATLPAVVAEGRRVIANIERVANLFVVKTVYSFCFAVLVGIFLTPFPFVPRHLTLVGTLTIGAPAFALALAPTAARARTGFVFRVMRFALPVGALAAAATYASYELAIAEGVSLTGARTLATVVLTAIGLFALIINARPLTPGRRLLIGSMAGLYGLILLVPSWRTFFELDIPRLVIVLAGVGIIGMTGALMYSALRAVGWLRQVPELLRTPFDPAGRLAVLRTGMQKMRDRAAGIGRPRPPREP